MSTPIVCPVCRKDDAIQKVSSVVTGGITSGAFSGPSGGVISVEGKRGVTGGYTTLSGITVSVLAQKLLPPPEPKVDNSTAPLGVLGLIALLAAFAYIFWWGNPSKDNLAINACGSILIGVLLLTLSVKAHQAERNRVAREKPIWEKSIQKWSRLYYCFRDDIVFDPLTGETCRPESLTAFLRSAS